MIRKTRKIRVHHGRLNEKLDEKRKDYEDDKERGWCKARITNKIIVFFFLLL